MARVNKNVVFISLRDLKKKKQVVYKRRAGKYYVASWPTVDPNRAPTEGQARVQNNTKRCNAYATQAVKDPELKRAYQAVATGRQNAHNMAFKDAQWPPEVVMLNTVAYKGAIGDVIIVGAMDDFKVVSVKVSIYNNADELIEEGEALQQNESIWVYKTTRKNENVRACTVKAIAYDLPGNEGVKEARLG